jgi:hypothetical protein
MDQDRLENRLAKIEENQARLESLLVELGKKLDRSGQEIHTGRESLKSWVTDYVSLRLQQLVPETCGHEPGEEPLKGTCLPGTSIPCTDEVLHRLGRIPIPFVREMVTQKVAQKAKEEGVAIVDVGFFERSATF